MKKTESNNYVEIILKDNNLTKNQKAEIINFIYNNYNKKLEEDLRNYLIKIWTGGLLEIGSAALPFAGAGKAGGIVGQKLLQKSIGRKLSQEIGSGTASGLASGGVFGTGRGMVEDKNPLITGLQDALIGLLTGSFAGGASAYLEKAVRAKLLENSKPLNKLSQAQIKNLVKRGRNYYKDYLSGTSVPYPLLDKIYFSNSQAGEIRPHNIKMVPKIPEQIRTAHGLKYSNDKPWREDANNFYKLYNTYKGKNYEYVIRNNANKTGNNFYQIKEVDPSSAYLHHNQALEPRSNNIINDISKNFNPVPPDILKILQNLNKSTATQSVFSPPAPKLSSEKGDNSIFALAANKSIINDISKNFNPISTIIPLQTLQNLQENEQPSFLLEGSVDINVDKYGNHIFTPEEIAQMDSDVFRANESAIMKQLQAGLIGQQIKNFANFTNPITGDNRIFSREDIGAMSGDEYSANESAIMEQLKSIGIPTGNELEASSIFGGGTVYVRPYTRSDGTEVKGYWRSLPAY